ncbi:MAG: NAD-dependent epimerase/dehydratase family protein [Betaproteobacteria bacterium]|nr:NAD-dependent epimerase/dehydratase family protein [Betaproteobacteria bacterium]
MKCLILGGGGFLGSHLCEALLAQGHCVRIFDRPNLSRFISANSTPKLEWFEGDFINQDDVSRAVAGCEVVYHLISTTLPRSSNENPAYDVETNVVGTLHMLEAARRNGVRKIIFISSGGTVYGIPQTVPVKESHPTEPICSYGIGKLAIEKYLSLFDRLYGMDYCVLRLANPFGERQRIAADQGAVAVFLDKALRNEEITIWGDGSVVRDYFYVGDAVTAMTKALAYTGPSGVFNIGSGAGQSLNQILDAIETLLGTTVRRAHLPARGFDVPISVLDISKAAEFLDWRPHTTFADGLSRTVRWLQMG